MAMFKQIVSLAAIVLAMSNSNAIAKTTKGNDVGKTAFEHNCKACHDLKKFTVGPSLIEIRDSYPLTKQQAFVAWALNPGRNRPEAIPMPAMTHVGEENLKLIHGHILAVSKGVKVTQDRHNFSFKPPAPRYPHIKRGYMPFTSPASIAVVFSPKLGLAWDTEKGRVSYAYPGHINFRSGEKHLAERKSAIFYQETAEHFWSFGQGDKAKFLGYRVKQGLPEFEYQIGGARVKERFSLGKGDHSFTRTYRISGLEQAITLNLAHQGNAIIRSSAGTVNKDNQLTVPASALAEFSVTVGIIE